MRNLRHGSRPILALIVHFVIAAAVVVAVIVFFAILLIIKISSLVLRKLFRAFPA
jgi:hypothetical protein